MHALTDCGPFCASRAPGMYLLQRPRQALRTSALRDSMLPLGKKRLAHLPGTRVGTNRGFSARLAAPAHACDELVLETQFADFSKLLLSQRVFTVLLTGDDVAVPSLQLPDFLLRRLRLPLPLGPRRCSCRGTLDE